MQKTTYDEFGRKFLRILNKHAPVSSSFKTKYFTTTSNDSFKPFKKRKKNRKGEERNPNSNLSFVIHNKNFWKVVKSLFTEERALQEIIKLFFQKKTNLVIMIRRFP